MGEKASADDFAQKMLQKMKQQQEVFEDPTEKLKVVEKPKKDNSKQEARDLLRMERMKYKKKQTLSKSTRQKKTMETLASFKSKLKEQYQQKPKEPEKKEPEKELMYDKDY